MHALPIPSRRAERPARPAARLKPFAAAVLGLAAASLAQAHDLAADPLPEQPGLRLGATAVWSHLAASADQVLPTARYAGWLGSGQTPADRRGSGLEHAALDLGLRLGARTGAQLAWGKHGSDRSHAEAVKLITRQPAPDLPALGAGEFELSAGRDRLPVGDVVNAAGHLDRFALVPLAKRLVLNDDWIDDGAQLQWRSAAGDTATPRVTGLGLSWWRARKFPGATHSGSGAPLLQLTAEAGELRGQAFLTSFSVTGRGSVAAFSSAGHSHAVPDCSRSLVALVCFDGRSTLGGASLSWTPHHSNWRLQGAWLSQLERGQLYSLNGDVAYRGVSQGGWADALLRLAPQWQAAARLETLQTRQRLVGPGASLVSQDAGLTANRPVRREALSLGWTPHRHLTAWLEAGAEQPGADPVSGGTAPGQRWIALRLVMGSDTLWSRAW